MIWIVNLILNPLWKVANGSSLIQGGTVFEVSSHGTYIRERYYGYLLPFPYKEEGVGSSPIAPIDLK